MTETLDTKNRKQRTVTKLPAWIWVEVLRPSQQFFSHAGTESPHAGYYEYFFGR